MNDLFKSLEKQLETARRRDDFPTVAKVQWQLAQLDIKQSDFVSALARVMESLNLNRKLGRIDGVCAVGLVAGQLMAAGGQHEEARAILTEVRNGFQKLGQPRGVQQADKLIGLLDSGGPPQPSMN